MVEEGLQWLVSTGRLRAASMRYFNAAGGTLAHPERHRPEIHLIPIALDAADGRREFLEIYGDDYPTPDGTCIRDYIHVSDLAEAHVLAITALEDHRELTLNLGSGIGYSNRQVVETIKRVTGREFEVRYTDRRPGDPAAAVASNKKAREILGWELERSDLDVIVADAWSAYQSTVRLWTSGLTPAHRGRVRQELRCRAPLASSTGSVALESRSCPRAVAPLNVVPMR